MNKKIYAAKNSIIKQKKFYWFLATLMMTGIVAGLLFIFFLNKTDKTGVVQEVTNFFDLVKSSEGINYSKSLFNTIFIDVGYILLIWLLGLSIIGFPIILAILFMKSFIFGFSISSIISAYGIKGVLAAILYNFPHNIVLILLYLLLGFYSLSFCYKLFSHLFLKKSINFNRGMNKYLKILIISIIITILVSLYEVFLSTYFIKLFTAIIK